MNTYNVKSLGAVGDGAADDYKAFAAALDGENRKVVIPEGKYLVGGVLRVHSGTEIIAEPGAQIRMADGVCRGRNDAMLTNADHEGGDSRIHICGGLWDGNNKGNPRAAGGLFAEGYTGSMFRFINVDCLTIEKLTMTDPEAYYIALCRVRNFTVHGITFEVGNLGKNQDGVHLAGFCENGLIRSISGVGSATNDDLIALNADDCVTRTTNLGLERGYIKNVAVRNVSAESCHTLVRILSCTSRVDGVTVEGVAGGCRCSALNLDCARYCLTPLFDKSAVGVGSLGRVEISNVRAWKTARNDTPLIMYETDADAFSLKGFTRVAEKDAYPEAQELRLRNLGKSRIALNGDKRVYYEGETLCSAGVTELSVERIR